MQEQEDISNAERERSTTRKPEKTFKEMFNTVGFSLSNHASSDDEEDGEDEEDEEDTEPGKLSEDDESGWVMGTISKTVQHRMESFGQKQLRIDKLTQPGWRDIANYFRERNMKYGTAKLMVPAVVKPQTDTAAATPLLTTFGDLMQIVDIIPGQSQMPQGTFRPGSNQMRLGSEKPQSYTDIASLLLDVVANSSPIENGRALEPVSIDPRILCP